MRIMRKLPAAGEHRYVRSRARAQDSLRYRASRRALRAAEDRCHAGWRYQRASAAPDDAVDDRAVASRAVSDDRAVDRCGHRRRLDRDVERSVPDAESHGSWPRRDERTHRQPPNQLTRQIAASLFSASLWRRWGSRLSTQAGFRILKEL